MPIRFSLFALVAMAATTLLADEPQPASFTCKPTKVQDQVTVTIEKERTLLDVVSPSGIGGTTVELSRGSWPSKVVVRLHLRGLEQFTSSSGRAKLDGSMLSHSGNTRRLTVREQGKDGEQRFNDAIQVFNAEGKPIDGLPPAGGYFEVTLPKPMLEGQPKSLYMGWIDFFR